MAGRSSSQHYLNTVGISTARALPAADDMPLACGSDTRRGVWEETLGGAPHRRPASAASSQAHRGAQPVAQARFLAAFSSDTAVQTDAAAWWEVVGTIAVTVLRPSPNTSGSCRIDALARRATRIIPLRRPPPGQTHSRHRSGRQWPQLLAHRRRRRRLRLRPRPIPRQHHERATCPTGRWYRRAPRDGWVDRLIVPAARPSS
jgi:hypothetical protein